MKERGKLALNDRRLKEAEGWLRKAVALAPADYPASYALSLCLERAGKPVPIWLTEFAWRTAPTPHLGVISAPLQATLLQQTVSLVVDHEPYVDMLIWFLVRDETPTSYWRSGLVTFGWHKKPAFNAYRRLVQTSS